MSTEAMRELKTLASVCPELNMANYGEDDVRHLNEWAIEMSLLAEKVATTEPVMDVRCEGCGYMTHHREHMGCVRAAKQHTHQAPSVPSLIEKAISSGCFGVLPVKATIPMCKAGWGASSGELTFQQIGHIYEEMYKARPLPDDAIYAAPRVPDDVVRDAERGRFLVGWLKRFGLLQTEFGQIGAGEKPENWWLLHAPWGIDKTRPFFGHGKTPEQAIDAAKDAT